MKTKKTNNLRRIDKIIRRAPFKCGVYYFVGAGDQVLYVGKAKSIRKRLAQHFNSKNIEAQPKMRSIVEAIKTIRWSAAPSELDAVFMENQAIKTHQPPYNVLLKDDKTFPYLRLTISHDFPKLTMTRKPAAAHPKDVVIGPLRSAAHARALTDLCERLFKVRSCSDYFFKATRRPCLAYQLKRCLAPCVGLQSREDYQARIERMRKLLTGRGRHVLGELRRQMRAHARAERFAEAAERRDEIAVLESFLSDSHATFGGLEGHSDFWTIYNQSAAVLHVRYGVIQGQRLFRPQKRGTDVSDDEILARVLSAYGKELVAPSRIYVARRPSELALIKAVIFKNTGMRPPIVTPRTSQEKTLMSFLAEWVAEAARGDAPPAPATDTARLLGQRLRDFFRLERVPDHFEAIDVSHFQGAYTVGAAVVFNRRGPVKAAYRYYKIRTAGINDPAGIKEVCARRYDRAREQKALPDVVLIDGGRGQLNAAASAIASLGLSDAIRVAAIAKNPNERYGGEKIFMPHLKGAILLKPDHPLYGFICRLRDEAHRFGIQYQRRRFAKKAADTADLSKIPGLGPKRQAMVKMLLIAKGVGGMLEQAEPPTGFSKKLWTAVLAYLRGLDKPTDAA